MIEITTKTAEAAVYDRTAKGQRSWFFDNRIYSLGVAVSKREGGDARGTGRDLEREGRYSKTKPKRSQNEAKSVLILNEGRT